MNALNEELEKDLTTAINKLFNSLPEPETFKSLKDLLFNSYKKLHFYFDKNGRFNNKINPTLEFKNGELLINFLKQEKNLSVKFQEFEEAAEINKMIESYVGLTSIDHFNLYYSLGISKDDRIKVVFKTNSLILKYELLGRI
jgi:hypothetical protein